MIEMRFRGRREVESKPYYREFAPVVDWEVMLQLDSPYGVRRRMPRAIGAVLVIVSIAVALIGAVTVGVVVAAEQSGSTRAASSSPCALVGGPGDIRQSGTDPSTSADRAPTRRVTVPEGSVGGGSGTSSGGSAVVSTPTTQCRPEAGSGIRNSSGSQ